MIHFSFFNQKSYSTFLNLILTSTNFFKYFLLFQILLFKLPTYFSSIYTNKNISNFYIYIGPNFIHSSLIPIIHTSNFIQNYMSNFIQNYISSVFFYKYRILKKIFFFFLFVSFQIQTNINYCFIKIIFNYLLQKKK